MADTGTLFLDEVGDMPLELQPKLLTFLQDRTVQRIGDTKVRKVNVRVIAATHQNLQEKCNQGSFRQGLYFRLNVLPLRLAPLRERIGDIIPLTQSILTRIAEQRGQHPFELSPDAASALEGHTWPGNIRELENVLERSTAFAKGSRITATDLGIESAARPAGGSVSQATSANLAGMTLAEIERRAIIETLAACEGNKKAASRMLGIDEKSIYNKMKRLGIPN
jgi:DNA-binding NtrC family response regulator